MNFGIIGSGSWATALAKILTDKKNRISWWVRNEDRLRHIEQRFHNPHYLSSAYFNVSLLKLSSSITDVIRSSDILVIAIPSAYVREALSVTSPEDWRGKKVVSAIKGLLPEKNVLLNYHLEKEFGLSLEDYFAVLGPCHAEEVAAEKLSYLTFSGTDIAMASSIATEFTSDYISTIVNHDILGVQYAAVLKNIYALGAGIARGLD